jgi:O-antigen/teichoic acid export membrane protein
MSLNYVLTYQLIGWHGQRAYASVCALALALNIGLNLWLIPAYSIEGEAWATVCTEVFVTIGCAWGLRVRLLVRSSDLQGVLATVGKAIASR